MDILLIVVLVALLGFMFWNSRKRMQKMKAEQEQKNRQTVPGAEVLLQGGIYGTIVQFDPEDLDEPALIEVAPGTVLRVHSQAIIRVITPLDAEDDELADETAGEEWNEAESADAPAIERIDPEADGPRKPDA
ncbi:preprotein translocase subunit YajC [Microbacterium sp. LRZ72]|uniref:preprotein translocase subunit YajC n=1 Tax=Microbacterium sp. LRZ72 TaxID=2942481 RepID=UPI0029A5905B|nr:preprotein translocase subunit YajC [Microbacterium sp. LRZ72]MDX2375366.1 preprotein translocase subunit YajC [Microbacterium sp. LRZ72]